MIAPMIAAAVGDQLPADQLTRLCELISEVTDRLSMADLVGVMGDLMAIQAYVQAGNLDAAKYRAMELADRHDAHELAAFLGELAVRGNAAHSE